MRLSRQETLNYWKQLSHVMKYFRAEEDPEQTRLPNGFVAGFLEVSRAISLAHKIIKTNRPGPELNYLYLKRSCHSICV